MDEEVWDDFMTNDVPLSLVWGLVRINPLCQKKYIEHLGEYHPDVQSYFPRYNHVIRPSRGPRPRVSHSVVIPRPVYPGYVFVRLDCDLSDVLDAPMRVYFVRFGGGGQARNGRIGTVKNEVIVELKRKEAMGLLMKEDVKENPFAPGRFVQVHTPIADIKGIIVMCSGSNNRVVVDTVMGHWDVPIGQVTVV